jgi:hypothetical protein
MCTNYCPLFFFSIKLTLFCYNSNLLSFHFFYRYVIQNMHEELETFLKEHCRGVDDDEELHKHRYWDMFQGKRCWPFVYLAYGFERVQTMCPNNVLIVPTTLCIGCIFFLGHTCFTTETKITPNCWKAN